VTLTKLTIPGGVLAFCNCGGGGSPPGVAGGIEGVEDDAGAANAGGAGAPWQLATPAAAKNKTERACSMATTSAVEETHAARQPDGRPVATPPI
jgi:hypothetical protein